MSKQLRSDGRIFDQVCIHVDSELKSAAKAKGVCFSRVFAEALKKVVEGVDEIQ